MEGWIRYYRKSVENSMYFSEPFTRWQAWTDMLIIANHKPGSFIKRGIRVDVGVGQTGYDVENLAKRWKWSRGKVERFLCMLESDNQITRQKNNVTTLISICKYKDYQIDSKAKNKPNDNSNSKANGHQTVKQTDTNKNEENKKNDKEEIDKSISLSEKERIFKIFFFEKGIINPEKEIERFNAHYEKTGWKDANGNDIINKCACALNWKTKEVTSGNADFINRWKKIHSEMSVNFESECNCMIFGLKSIKITGQSITLTSTKDLFDLVENSTGEIQIIIRLIQKYFSGFKFMWNVITI
jgi:hypothetical protein